MSYSLDQLISIILAESERLEEQVKQKTDLQNLTFKQLHAIEIIYKSGNPTLSELSGQLSITKPSTTAMVDKLSEQGYIKKVKSDSDKRSAHLHLTQKGFHAAQLHERVHHDFADILTKELSPSEKEIMLVLLNKAIKGIIGKEKKVK